jgi:hypothetical protein
MELLPCDYFHVILTIPDTLHHVFHSRPKRMYSLLMNTNSESLIQLADDPKHLDVWVGILAVLYTWANNLTYHLHIHMLITRDRIRQLRFFDSTCKTRIMYGIFENLVLEWRVPVTVYQNSRKKWLLYVFARLRCCFLRKNSLILPEYL